MSHPAGPAGPTFMDYAAVAELLGVSEHWLRKAVREQRIPHTRLSDRVVRFTTADLDALVAERAVKPTEAPTKKAAPSARRKRSA